MDEESTELDTTMSSQRGEQLTTVIDTLNQQLNQPLQGSDVRVEMGDDVPEPGPAGPEHGHTHASGEATREINPIAMVMPFVSKFGIFVVILLLKILYSHRYGLLIVIAAAATWYHANNLLTTQITLRGHTRYKLFVSKLLWVMTFLTACMFGVYYFLNNDGILSDRLIFRTSHSLEDIELWMLLWILILNDYCIKYATIIIKSLITLTPKTIISYQQKGSIYSALERVTELYRSLIPIVPWYYFLIGNADGPWFSAILFILYVVFKFLNLYSLFGPLKTSLSRVIFNNVCFGRAGVIQFETSYGRAPSNTELESAGETCPVCHEEYSGPIMLTCKHVFCEDCVLVWFDRETSCPMCRAQIVTGDNSYRDGSSIPTIQFF